jgi:hypothetical protein
LRQTPRGANRFILRVAISRFPFGCNTGVIGGAPLYDPVASFTECAGS